MEHHDFDPVKYGVLWQRVQDMDKKMDKMERQIEQLTEAQVVGWVKAAMGEETVAAQEAAVAAQIEEAKAPKTATGVPW